MKDFLGDFIKGALGLFEEAYSNRWFLYAIIALIIIVIFLIFSRNALTPTDIFG